MSRDETHRLPAILGFPDIAGLRTWHDIYVDRSGECWRWIGASRHFGYGSFTVGCVPWTAPGNRFTISAHRASWMFAHGSIPDGMWVLHRCDVPACVRPDHLFLGDHDANMKDKASKGRAPSLAGESNGNSRLTRDRVASLRALYAAGGYTFKALAREFGVSGRTVAAIVRRETWRMEGVA